MCGHQSRPLILGMKRTKVSQKIEKIFTRNILINWIFHFSFDELRLLSSTLTVTMYGGHLTLDDVGDTYR